MTRCPACYRPLDAAHRLLGRCVMPAPPCVRPVASQRGYVPPSRQHRVPRDEYLAAVRVDPEAKRAHARERQRRYKARKQAA